MPIGFLPRQLFAVGFMALALATPIHAQLFGLPKFKVEQSDDRFSIDGLTTYSAMWNRISKKSLAGGTHIDAKGVFVEPIVIKNRSNGSLQRLAFFIRNEAFYDTAYGAPLTFGTLKKITFLTGEGMPIALAIEKPESRWNDVTSYNSVTKSASSGILESGFAPVTPDQYQRILAATGLAVKVEGDKRSMIYETKDISKTFIPNLKSFYDGYVATK